MKPSDGRRERSRSAMSSGSSSDGSRRHDGRSRATRPRPPPPPRRQRRTAASETDVDTEDESDTDTFRSDSASDVPSVLSAITAATGAAVAGRKLAARWSGAAVLHIGLMAVMLSTAVYMVMRARSESRRLDKELDMMRTEMQANGVSAQEVAAIAREQLRRLVPPPLPAPVTKDTDAPVQPAPTTDTMPSTETVVPSEMRAIDEDDDDDADGGYTLVTSPARPDTRDGTSQKDLSSEDNATSVRSGDTAIDGVVMSDGAEQHARKTSKGIQKHVPLITGVSPDVTDYDAIVRGEATRGDAHEI